MEEPQKDTSVVISAAPENQPADEGITLSVGDYIKFTKGPRLAEGMVYYLDEDILRILPSDKSDTLIEISTDIFADDSTEFELEQTPLQTFIDIVDLHEGNDVQTFDGQGTSTAVYRVKSLNPDEDSAVFEEKETGDELLLEFRKDGITRGIPPDVPFKVIIAQDAEKPKEAEARPSEEEEPEIEIEEVVEEPEVVVEEEYRRQRPEEVTYDENEQKRDFIDMEIAALKPEKQDNPKVLARIQRLMNNCLQLKNEVLEYTDSGRVELKPVVYETLSQLLTQTNFPLSKQVLHVGKSIYGDHSVNHFLGVSVDPSSSEENTIDFHYLDDAVQDGIAFLEDQFKRKREEGLEVGQLPQLYTTFQLFFNDYYRTMKALKGGKKVVPEKDHDFFRFNVYDFLESPLKGISRVGNEKGKIVTVNDIETITLSYMRTLAPRIGRYGDRKLKIQGPIESGDEAEIRLYLLFPFLFLRDLGAIRSGKLSMDVGNGQGAPKTMEMILDEGGGIKRIAKVGDIIAVDPLGETVGNIEVESWLSGQTLYGSGLGDILPYLKSLGMGTAEFTPEQQLVLIKKIQAYQANLKKYLIDMRKKAKEALESVVVKNNNLLNDDAVEKFLKDVIRGEAILIEAVADFKREYPYWEKNDMATFAYLYVRYPDFVLASASGQPDVAIERKRVLDDSFLKRLHEALEFKKKMEERGDDPIINECDHVKNLEDIRKIKDDDQRIQVIIRELLPRFQGPTKDHWVECKVCDQHLMCEHEYLMILERTHPNQQGVIHKKILLNFSDGVFNGKFMCGNCGQPIQDLDFDKTLEFTDDGRPMIGDEPISGEMETSLAKEIDKLLEVSTETYTGKPRAAGKEQDIRIPLLDEISKKVGIYLPADSIERMLRTIDRVVENRSYKDPATYNAAIKVLQKERQDKGEKAVIYPSYDEYYTEFVIAVSSSALFVEIQSAIPEYVIRGKAEGCGDATFEGYPLIKDDTQIDGLKYVACAVATLVRAEKPWGNTTWVKMATKDAITRRTTSILRSMRNQIDKILGEAEIQTLLEKKREYLRKEKGEQALTGRYVDEIPSDFLPRPVILTEEQTKAAAAPTIAEGAEPRQKAFAWLLQGYALARTFGKYEVGNPLSEATCCYSPLESPMAFWREQGTVRLGPKRPPLGPRGNVLTLTSTTRKSEALLGEPDPRLMYRLFLRVCFKGPRVGLQHEPGYNNICPYCGLKFPVDPRLPPPVLSYSKNKDLQKKYEAEFGTEVQELYQKEISALREAGVVEGDAVQKETFTDLLQEVYSRFLIPPLTPKPVTTDLATIDELIELNPEPFTGYKTSMQIVRSELVKLTPDAGKDEIALAYAEISNKMRMFMDSFRSTILQDVGDEEKRKKVARQWTILTSAPAQSLGEMLRTFFLLPFQRLGKNLEPTSLTTIKRQAVYTTIGTTERQTLERFLDKHWNLTKLIVSEIDKLKSEERKRQCIEKIEEFISKLTVIIPLFIKILRANVLPFGTIGLSYIQGAILSGLFSEFINPEPLGGAKTLRNCLLFCFLKSQEPDENVIKTPEEIRRIITGRNESEKVEIINELDRMTPEEKRAELLMKKLGLGRWARGASKGIFSYDEEQQAFEAEERRRRGLVDFDVEATGEGYDVAANDGEE